MHPFNMILGLLVIIAMPYMSGYTIKTILKAVNKRETGQIETYLIGFFFHFLLQGMIFSIGELVLKAPVDSLYGAYSIALIIVSVVFVICLVSSLLIHKTEHSEEKHRQRLKRDEWILLAVIVLIGLLVTIRIVSIREYLRDDYMLPFIRTILSTNTLYEYNPITSRPYTVGMIISRKIITLPVYYSYICRTFGFDAIDLIYIFATLQTVICTFMSCMLFISPIIRVREKRLIYAAFLGGLILSGDYFNQSIGTRLLWNGYAGSTIVVAVMLPYVLYLIISDLHEKVFRPVTLILIILMIAASIFMTSVATGALLIVIVTGIAVISCFIVAKSGKQEDTVRIVEE